VIQLTTANATDEWETRGFAATDRLAVDVKFRRARRHSRRVRLLRIAIPVVLAIGIGATTFVIWFNPLRMLSNLPSSVGSLIMSGSKMTMTKPKIAGYTRDEQRYELSATAAAQDATRIDVVNLEEPRATLEMLDRSKIDMKAEVGIFDRKASILTLRRDIVITSTSGYEMRLSQAVIDIRNGNIVSEQPVEVKMQQGTIQGNRLEVTKSGEVIRFDGGVTMILVPENAKPDNLRTQPR
jgi:lipopolysaccharide export system protein LptC